MLESDGQTKRDFYRENGSNEFPGFICNLGAKIAIESSEINNVGNRISENGLVTYPDVLNIIYMIGETITVNFKIVNLYGQEIMRLDEDAVRSQGTIHNIKMHTSHLLSGSYFCILQVGSEVKVSKIVKVL